MAHAVPNSGFPAIPVGHPRLLFNRSELPGLRARATTPPFDTILARMRDPMDTPSDPYYNATHTLDLAAVGVIADEPESCAAALTGAWDIVNRSGLWANTTARGLTRAYYSRAVAVSFDLCHDEWPAWATDTLSTALLANGYSLMLAFDGVNGLGNNHEAVVRRQPHRVEAPLEDGCAG